MNTTVARGMGDRELGITRAAAGDSEAMLGEALFNSPPSSAPTGPYAQQETADK
jgi:hypothetical protein